MTNTPATLATAFDSDARTIRKFLRSPASGIDSVGKGSRYSLPGSKREVNALKKRFDAWSEARAPKVTDETPEAIDDAPDAD